MANHYSLSMIIAWWIFKFSDSSFSSLDYCVFFVFSQTFSFHNTPFDSEGRGESASEEASLLWVFFNSIVMARLVLKGAEGLGKPLGKWHWTLEFSPSALSLLLFHGSWGWSKGSGLVKVTTLYLYIGSLSFLFHL